MFTCDNCNTIPIAGQPVNMVVTEKKSVQYNNFVRSKGSNKGYWKTSDGFEIAKEIKACPSCFSTLTGKTPKIAQPKPQPAPLKTEKLFKPRRTSFKAKKPVDKTDPNWKYKQELDEIRRREAKSSDPRGQVERKKPIVETINPITKQ